MAKIKLIKGKATLGKRNLFRALTTLLTYLNTIAVIYILLKLHNLI